MFARLETLQDIENAIGAVEEKNQLQFHVGSINKHHGALRDAARLQALITIARLSEFKNLELVKSRSEREAAEELCRYSPGIAAIRLHESLSNNGVKISMRDALSFARQRMEHADSFKLEEIIRGRTIDFCCVSGAKRQYLSPLFSRRSPEAVRDPVSMRSTMVRIFKLINHREFFNLDGELLDALGIFSSELFKNTQEHACTDISGQKYIDHVEGIIISWDNLSEEMFKQEFQAHERLADYWNFNISASRKGSVNTFRCMQVSFFDSGPGLVGRAFGESSEKMTHDDERIALIKCLAKNFTSKNQSGAGLGYSIILNQLRKVGGLIRIRSGRQCVFNCFNHQKMGTTIQNELSNDELLKFDSWWNKNLSPVAGTVVTLIIPLRHNSGQQSLL